MGLFQSLAWMANRGALVVGYRRGRAAECAACYAAGGPEHAACEGVCPMRLKPRTTKVKMFTCTQCTQCIDACTTVQAARGKESLLQWVDEDEARKNEAQGEPDRGAGLITMRQPPSTIERSELVSRLLREEEDGRRRAFMPSGITVTPP